MIKFILIFLILSITANMGFCGTAELEGGINSDSIFYKTNNPDSATSSTSINADFTGKTMVFQFEIEYDTEIFKFDSNHILPGAFLTNIIDIENDTYLFVVYDDSSYGKVKVTGARMATDDSNKGITGLYSLINSIRFKMNQDINLTIVNTKKIIVTNFKFYSDSGDTVYVSSDRIEWTLFSKILSGDINNDGIVNSTDLSYLRNFRYLFQ
ncbi:hypothetical protein KA977_03465 [Candidatus Dependentiae bacterium]|nr:hypothetical protein [Candidatus Dependentiae bacterium]